MKNTSNKSGLIEIFVDSDGREWKVCSDTGEMTLRSKVKKLPAFSDKYYGLDTKTIEECHTEDQLLEVTSLLDGYTKDKIHINDTFLTENIVEGFLTPKQLTLLRSIAKRVCVWNIYIGTRTELISFGVDPKSVPKTLKELDKFLKVVSTDVPDKGCIRIVLNPLLVWKGDIEWRNTMKNKWYSVSDDSVL